MAASKPTSWLSGEINFLSHLARFRDLRWRSGLFPSRHMKLSPHGLTASSNNTDYSEFDSCRQLSPPNANQCSTRQLSMGAIPKYISRRTSYLRVRLAFHPYPQVIPQLYSAGRFGPPHTFYSGFILLMGRSPGFGSANYYLYVAQLVLAFATPTPVCGVKLAIIDNSLAHSSKGTISPCTTGKSEIRNTKS